MGTVEYQSRQDSAEYRELLEIVHSADPSGALILGGVGMGKTSLVEAVLHAPLVPEPVMRLYCSPNLSGVPYGVLSPYLGGLTSIDSPVQVLREINRTLGDTPPDQAKIVVVEDAHYLDPQSCFVLSLMVENAKLKLIALGAGAVEPDSPLGTLAESTMMRTIVVQPLDLKGVRALVGGMIEGRLSEGSLRIIWLASGGNPSLVEAYLASSLEQGTLYRDDSLTQGHGRGYPLWIVARPLPEVDASLRDLVREMHRLTPQDERRTLELLALGGPQPGSLLQACDSPYRRMLDAGQLLLLPDGTIAMTSKLHQKVLRQMVSAQRNGQLYELWRAASERLELAPTPQQLLWGLELGHGAPEAELLHAVQHAEANREYTLAHNLCTISQLSRRSHAGALLDAKVLIGLGRFHSARPLLQRLTEHDTDPGRLCEAFNLALMMLVSLDAGPKEIAGLEARWDQRTLDFADDEPARRAIAARRVERELYALWTRLNTPGSARPALAELEAMLRNSELAVEPRTVLWLMISDLHGIEGRIESAYEAVLRAQRESRREHRVEARFEPVLIQRLGWYLSFLGRYEQTAALIEENRGNRVRQVQLRQGVLALLEGHCQLLQGRFRLASEKLVEAITELRMSDPAALLPLAIHLHHVALDRRGLQGNMTSGPVPGEVPEPVSQFAIFNSFQATQLLWTRAMAAAAGMPVEGETLADFPLIEREVLYSSTWQFTDEELARDPAQRRLAELAGRQEGTRAALVAELARLRTSDDGAALEALAQRAVRQHEYRIAVEALSRAATRHSESGDPRRCGELLRQVARLLNEQRMDTGKYVSRALALAELTAREAEIVALAREGKNNAQIARSLTVSQRTVEGHLYRVFSKLGISERSELKHVGVQQETNGYR